MPAAGFVTGPGNGKEYPGNLTPYVTVTCIIAAMGGLIFGYDIGISGGVTSMDSFLKKFFPSVYEKQLTDSSTNRYCIFDSQILTMFTSSLYLAALVSSLVASTVTRKLGRKFSMLLGGLFFLAGALVNGFAQRVWMLIVGRILLGFGIGFVNQSVPLYLSEMAPYKYRGALNIGFQLSITIGILVANVLNYFFAKIKGGWGWRLSLGGALVPALIITIGSLVLPETPNSMIERGNHKEAKAKLKQIRGVDDVDDEFNDLVAASEVSKLIKHPWRNLLQRKYRPQLVMAIAIPFFQQFTGINVIMFYAPVLFYTIGFKSDASLMSSVITGCVNVAATMVSIYCVDKWGRRFLFLQGGTQMLICQIVVAACIGAKFGIDGNPGDLPKWYASVVVIFICIYVAGFAWSWGPLGWLVPSEIFPLEIRSAAQSINVSVNMIFTFLVAQIFLTMLCHLKFGLFLFFAFFVVVMTICVYFFLPETKNIPIEEMVVVWKKHWYWSRFMSDVDYPKSLTESKFEENLNHVKFEELPLFKLETLSLATDHFPLKNKLGQGGFGAVYKGKLIDGKEIAVKRLSRSSNQGVEEFMNEVVVISKLQHRNLVRLLGCCIEGGEKMLVYEYMPNKSLDAFLFDPQMQSLLDWSKRLSIIEGIGRGLLYLHRDSRLRIIHRDLKASNILLDEELNPKISDFGMARIFGGTQNQANTLRVVGTYGYMAPEYAMNGQFSEKSDVYSFGVLLLEIVSGRRNTSFYKDDKYLSLLQYVWKMWNEDNALAIIDSRIVREEFEIEILRCIHIGLLCVHEYAVDMPNISSVLYMLSSDVSSLAKPKQPAFTERPHLSQQSQSGCSLNDYTITYMEGR